MEKQKSIHYTDNIKEAACLVTAGYDLTGIERIVQDGAERCVFELATSTEMHSMPAKELADVLHSPRELGDDVDAIIARRNITPEEYCLMLVDAARVALDNRGSLMIAAKSRTPLHAKNINGRMLIYRAGIGKDALRKLSNA